jgi:nucleoside-diphosphate-sugar epimerase
MTHPAINNSREILIEDFGRIFSTALPWERLEGSTLLITGATGYIARYLVEFLIYLNETKLSEPCKVIALVRSHEKAQLHFSRHLGRDDFKLLVQDVCDPIGLSEPVHYIIHAASQSLPKNYARDPSGSIRPNVIGTCNLLEFARTSQCRSFLFLSSGEVYGKFEPPPSEPIDETVFGNLDPLDPRSCYAESKRAAETMCKAWNQQFSVPAKIARLGHTYGPGIDLEDGRVFADFTGHIVRGEDIVLKSQGNDFRQFCYLSDTAAGLWAVLLKGVDAEAYNLVNVEAEIRIAELAELMCGLFPGRKLRVIKPLPVPENAAKQPWNPGVQVNIDKITGIGWRPLIGLREGFRRTIAFYAAPPGA